MTTLDRWQWYTATQTEVSCSGENHWVRWDRGELVPLNHTAGEQTLAALAGDRPACFELVQLWSHHHDDLRVLTLASRGANDPLLPPSPNPGWYSTAAPLPRSPGPAGPPPSRATAVLRAVGSPAPRRVTGRPVRGMQPAPPPGEPHDPVARLITLAGPLADRLVATVAHSWVEYLEADHGEATEQDPALTAALYGRTLSALRTWLGAPSLTADVTMISEDQPSAISRDEHGIRIALPFSWIPEIYCRGLSIVLGHFVLRVAEATQTQLVLDAVGADLQVAKKITISL